MVNINLELINSNCDIDSIFGRLIGDLGRYSAEVSDIEGLENMLTYYLRFAGKRLRLLKLILVARMTGGLNEDIFRFIKAQEYANSAIFLHDDIIDHDEVRKGLPTLNKVIGSEKALLIGNVLHSLAFREAVNIKANSEVKDIIMKDFISSLAVEHLGQYRDLDYRWNFINGFEEWERMVIRHSGLYVISALKGVALLNGADNDLLKSISEYEKNCTLAGAAEDALVGFLGKKGRGDLKNGSFTILVSYATQGVGPKSMPMTAEDLERLINSSNAIELTVRYIRDKINLAVSALDKVSDSFEKSALIYLARQIEENVK